MSVCASLLSLILGALCASQVWAYIPNACQGRLDLTFILDQSESIVENDPLDQPYKNWKVLKNFVKAVITDLPIGGETRTALIKYSSAAQLMWQLDRHRFPNQVHQALDVLTHDGGNTNTPDALRMAREEVFRADRGDRHDAANVIILMTDGLSTVNTGRVPIEAQELHARGIDIFVVAIGEYTDQNELRSIVHDFSKNIITVDDFGQLEFIQRLLLHRVCGLPDPDPTDDNPPPSCNHIMDIALIVDNSGSVGSNYQELKQFLANVVDQFDVTPGQNRIAVVRFSDIAELEFRLGEIQDKVQLKSAILRMPFRDLDTNTSGGIRLTLRDVFSGSVGDRPHVRNVAILITDGVSTVEKDHTIQEAMRAKNAGVTFFVVGVTDKINAQELQLIASEPVIEHYFDSTAVRYLNALLYRLVTNVCTKKP